MSACPACSTPSSRNATCTAASWSVPTSRRSAACRACRRRSRSRAARICTACSTASPWWPTAGGRPTGRASSWRSPGTRATSPARAARISRPPRSGCPRAQPETILRQDGDVNAAFGKAAHVVEAAYHLSVPVAHRPGAAELHRAFRRRQDRDLGADPEPGARLEARRRHAGHPGIGDQGPHGPRRRRLRPAAEQRLHGRGRLDLQSRRRAGEAAVDPRRRHAARFLPARRLPLLQGRRRRATATCSPCPTISSPSARTAPSPPRPTWGRPSSRPAWSRISNSARR